MEGGWLLQYSDSSSWSLTEPGRNALVAGRWQQTRSAQKKADCGTWAEVGGWHRSGRPGDAAGLNLGEQVGFMEMKRRAAPSLPSFPLPWLKIDNLHNAVNPKAPDPVKESTFGATKPQQPPRKHITNTVKFCFFFNAANSYFMIEKKYFQANCANSKISSFGVLWPFLKKKVWSHDPGLKIKLFHFSELWYCWWRARTIMRTGQFQIIWFLYFTRVFISLSRLESCSSRLHDTVREDQKQILIHSIAGFGSFPLASMTRSAYAWHS